MPRLRNIFAGIGGGLEGLGAGLQKKEALDQTAQLRNDAQRQQLMEFNQRQQQADTAHQDSVREFLGRNLPIAQHMANAGQTNFNGVDLSPFKQTNQEIAQPGFGAIEKAPDEASMEGVLQNYLNAGGKQGPATPGGYNMPTKQLTLPGEDTYNNLSTAIGAKTAALNKQKLTNINASPHYDPITGASISSVGDQTVQMGPNTAQAADKEKQLGSARIEGEYSGPANAARLAYEAQLEALKNKDKLGKDLKAQQAQAQTALGASTALNQLRQLYTKAVTPRTAIGKGASMAGTLGNMAMAFGTGGAVGGGFDPINMVKNSVAASHPVLGSYFAPDVVKYTTTKEGLLPLLNAALGHVRWSKYERDALDSLVPDVNENPATANAKWQKLQFLVATGPLLSKLGPDDPNDPEGSFMTKMATMDRWQRLVESTPPGHDTAFDAVTGLEIPTFQGGPIAGPQPKKK